MMPSFYFPPKSASIDQRIMAVTSTDLVQFFDFANVSFTGNPPSAKFQDRAPGSCWLWQGRKNKAGYGLWRGNMLVHRVSYWAFNSRLPQHPEVCAHLCAVKACLNPQHLASFHTRENRWDRDLTVTRRTKAGYQTASKGDYMMRKAVRR